MTKLYRFIFVFVFMLFATRTAYGSDPFKVVNIPVDATGVTAIEAQEAALQQGQAKAADILLKRVTVPSEVAAKGVPSPTPEMIGRMIRALEISNEQRTAQRYYGEVTIAFNPTEVRRFLRANGLTLFSSQAQPRLAVALSNSPAVQAALNKALSSGGFINSLTPLKTTGGGYIDTSLANGNMSAAKLLAASHGVQYVTVFNGSETLDGVNVNMIDIAVLSEEVRRYPAVSGYNAGTALQNAVAVLETNWKEQSASFAATAQDLPVSILFNSHQDWRMLQDVIDDSAQIQSAQLTALSKDGALMILSYSGNIAKLTQELSYKGVGLKQDPKLGVVIGRSSYLR